MFVQNAQHYIVPIIAMRDADSNKRNEYFAVMRCHGAEHPFVFKYPAEMRWKRGARKARIIIDTRLLVTFVCCTDGQNGKKIREKKKQKRNASFVVVELNDVSKAAQ